MAEPAGPRGLVEEAFQAAEKRRRSAPSAAPSAAEVSGLRPPTDPEEARRRVLARQHPAWGHFVQAGERLVGPGVNITPHLLAALRRGQVPGIRAAEFPEELTRIQRCRRLPLGELQTGMVLGMDRRDIAGKVVARRGDVVSPDLVEDMKRWGVTHVHVVFERSLAQEQVALDAGETRVDLSRVGAVNLYVGEPPERARLSSSRVTIGMVLLFALVEVYYSFPQWAALLLGSLVPLSGLGLLLVRIMGHEARWEGPAPPAGAGAPGGSGSPIAAPAPEAGGPPGGGATAAARRCPNCGSSNEPLATSCQVCGHDLSRGGT